MTAEVHVVLALAKDAILIPSSALLGAGTDGKEQVQVVGADGKIETRSVEIGLDDKVNVEIRTGLQAGETVVASRKSGTFVKSLQIRRPMGF